MSPDRAAFRYPFDRRQRTRLAYMATAAATRWAAASGIDLMALARDPAVAAALDAGIRAEQCARALRPDIACRPTQPIHHHDAEVAKAQVAKQSRGRRHWKTKMWKRRTKLRQAKAEAFRLAGEG